MQTFRSITRTRVAQTVLAAAMVSLMSAALPAHAAPTPTECAALRNQVASLQAEIRALQVELGSAPTGAKAALVAEIKRLGALLAAAQRQLALCPPR